MHLRQKLQGHQKTHHNESNTFFVKISPKYENMNGGDGNDFLNNYIDMNALYGCR